MTIEIREGGSRRWALKPSRDGPAGALTIYYLSSDISGLSSSPTFSPAENAPTVQRGNGT